MAEIKYRKRGERFYGVYLGGKHIGDVAHRDLPTPAWVAWVDGKDELAEFGRRSSAAEWLVRQAEREPILPRTEGRGGAK